MVLRVFEPRYLSMIREVLNGDHQFVSALISAGSEVGGGDKRFDVGVMVEIDHVETADVGLLVYGHAMDIVDILEWNDTDVYPQVRCTKQARASFEEVELPEIQNQLCDLTNAVEGFFLLLASYDIPIPVPTDIFRSLLPTVDHQATVDELWTLFWTLVRLLPSTPLSRYELLFDRPLSDRIRRAHGEIEHLSDIVRFRYGT